MNYANPTLNAELLNARRNSTVSIMNLRVDRPIPLGKGHLSPQIDLYNMFNASTVTTENATYGPQWRNATDALIGRVVQIGMTVKF